MKENMKISDLPMETHSVTLLLRKGKKRRRVQGNVIEKGGKKHFVTRQSSTQSFGPGTQVLWYRKVVKEIK